MKSLSKQMRMGLKIAACLGNNFDSKVLEKAKKNNEVEDSFLDSCVEFGFLQNAGSDKYTWGKRYTCLRFAITHSCLNADHVFHLAAISISK